MTPPGYKTANGVTVPCEAGSFRSGWAVAGQAQTCVSCGAGVRAEKTDRITRYVPATNVPELVPVTTQPDDCCECLLGGSLCGSGSGGCVSRLRVLPSRCCRGVMLLGGHTTRTVCVEEINTKHASGLG